MNTVRA